MLTQGSIVQIHNDQRPPRPVVQLVDVRKISHPQTGDRYRLIISDGQHYTQGMLATQAISMVTTNQIVKGSIITLEEYMANLVQGKRVVIVLRCSVVQRDAAPIGTPISISEAGRAPAQPMAQQPMAQAPQRMNARGGQWGQQQHFAQAPAVPPASARSGGGGSWGGGGFNAPPRGGMSDGCQPITTLNPYQPSWKIKARVTSKSAVRHWKNARGEGKLFSVDLLDKDGGEMRATMFNDACDKFYPILEANRVYIISKGIVKMARKQFTHLKNDYEMTLNADAEVVPVADDSGIETQRYNFIKIGNISTIPANGYVDILGVVSHVGQIMKIMSTKAQKELDKRSLTVMDDTASVEVTLWNETAITFDETKLANNPVIAMRGARVSDFGGKSLSCGQSAPQIWPDRPEAHELQRWYTSTDPNDLNRVQSLTTAGGGGIGSASAPMKSFAAVKEEEIGMHLTEEKKSEYFSNVCWITAISHNIERPPWYMACPEKEVNFKVTESGDGTYYCEKNQKVYASYEPRYIVRFQCMDYSGQQWMSAFHDVAERLLEVPCRVAEGYQKNNQQDEFNKVFTDKTFKRVVFKCRARCDTSWQDEVRLRVDAMDFAEVDVVEESRNLIQKIQNMMGARGGGLQR